MVLMADAAEEFPAAASSNAMANARRAASDGLEYNGGS
ncbi:hypothetical protein Poly24_06140 [Rosistilla carotiformis]|uniref:Uncharacterized protein n=1 Tax=Rosistilla carotiformis TaxID=2528017 RepID=A0A518JMZ1_9BACT|nr:hypothetical protein Poly24_06140 [Rosistilla carotiformis]